MEPHLEKSEQKTKNVVESYYTRQLMLSLVVVEGVTHGT